MSKRAIIVDDHPIIRDALVTSLVSLGVFEEVETATSFQGLLASLEQSGAYDLLILDLSLADTSGSDGMVYVREHYPDIPVIIFSGNDSTEIIAQAFENGVHGFVPKSSPMPVVVNAIKIVLAGSTFIPPSAIRLMGYEPQQGHEAVATPEQDVVQFSPRQRMVFDQLMLGMPNKVIADRLHIAQGTVKTHLHSIFQILNVRNRAQAILKAQQLGLID